MESKDFVRWVSIESFAHVRKKLRESKSKVGEGKNSNTIDQEILDTQIRFFRNVLLISLVTYRAKIKLHGVNSGININLQNKSIHFQSRNQFVSSGAVCHF